MDLKNHIGAKVRAARQQKRFTQEQLAEAVGKTVETVSNIERGAMLTGLSTLEQVARVLDKPIGYFFEDAEDARRLSAARLKLEHQLRAVGERLAEDDLRLALDLLRMLESHRARR